MRKLVVVIACIFLFKPAYAQFTDFFDDGQIPKDQSSNNGWAYYSGDGVADMAFDQNPEGFATIKVNAMEDKLGIWWALIKRRVSHDLELAKLSQPNYELRVEARIRSNTVPRRVNLHLNTQRTTDFHSHLMEYDLADTTWHSISMTTNNFDALPGDSVYAQLALMDWGFDTYEVDIDYYNVEVVHVDKAGPDLGNPIPYHPEIPPVDSFEHHLEATENGMVDTQYRDINFSSWQDEHGLEILTVSGTQYVILRWDFEEPLTEGEITPGLLELTTHSIHRADGFETDLGIVRVVEILDGDENWVQNKVTFESFLNGKREAKVINGQMIIDWPVNPEKEGKTWFTINQAVMNRLIKSESKGLVINPLGAINASFFSKNSGDKNNSPKLYFNVKK